jgi:hypothetical protein
VKSVQKNPSAPPPSSSGYAYTISASLSPQIVPWVAAGSLVLVFFLSFFPWVGRYWGGTGVVTQSAWGAAFGGYSSDDVFESNTDWTRKSKDDEKPGAGALMIFFLFFGLIPSLLATLAAAGLPWLKTRYKMPEQVALVEPWRWLIAGGTTLLALLFLFLQLATSFSIESRTRDAVAASLAKARITANAGDQKWIDLKEARDLAATGLRRTAYLRLTFLLLILAAACSAAAHWLEHRGPGRPLPRIDVLW